MNRYSKLLDTPYDELHKEDSREDMAGTECIPVHGESSYALIIDGRNLTGKKVIIDGRLEEESKKSLNTFNSMLENVFRPSMNNPTNIRLDYAKGANNFDFSPLIMSLSKVFEIEMNNSVVQFIRQKNGIYMPENYNKYDKTRGAILVEVVDGDRKWEVDINPCYGNGMYKAFTMKDILLLTKMYSEAMSDEMSRLVERFKKVWDNIRIERNASAHLDVIDEQRFLNFYGKYCDMIKQGWFTHLMDLKVQMSGGR